MKTHHIPAILLAAACLLSACAQHEEFGISPDPQPATADAHAIIAQIQEPPARTTLDMSLNVVWQSGDQIRLFGATSTSGAVYITTSNNTRLGIFNPAGSQTVGDETRYAVYPASAAASATLSGSSLTVDLSGLANQPYVSALGAGSDVAALPMVAASTDQTFAFKNLCGGVQFQLNDYQGLGLKVKSVVVTALGNEQIAGTATVDATTGTAVVPKAAGSNSVTIDCGAGANISSGGDMTKASGFIAFLPAGVYDDGFSFTVTDTDGRVYTLSTRQAVTVTAGIVTPLAPLPVTLYYGSTNCYRTAAAGNVQIDITPYYTLSRDYIHENLKCLSASGAAVGAATKAKIVWQQAATGQSGDVVSTPSVGGMTLTVPATGTQGNAVVAICNAADVVLWSYHIWVSAAEDVPYNNTEIGNYTMQDRNLGATSKSVKDRNAYGLFYQWGRKDPFPRNLTGARPAGTPYETESSTLVSSQDATATTGTIAYATQNPGVRLLSAVDWHLASRNDALWGWVSASGGVKTVYDPCPAGYRVPDYNSLALLPGDDKGNSDAQYGLNIKTGVGETASYYPTAGYLFQSREIMQYLEYRGYMWNNQPSTGPNTASPASPNRFYYNNAGTNIIRSEYRSAGMSLRCVKVV